MSGDFDGSQSKNNSHDIIKNINSILGNSLNLSSLNLERTTIQENEVHVQDRLDTQKARDTRKESACLNALLGLKLNTNDAARSKNEIKRTKLAGENKREKIINESGLLSGKNHSQGLKSMNFSWPIGDNSGIRPRSLSFSSAHLEHKTAESCCSPNYGRPHSSEAGSPTLEQVLLMGGSPESYRSYSSDSYCNSYEDFSRTNYKSSEPRPTLSSLHDMDVAVAQAVQNLQNLQEKRASVYANLGGLSNLTPEEVPSRCQENTGDLNNNDSDRNNNFSSPPPPPSPLHRPYRRPFNNNAESKPWQRYHEPAMSLEKAARAYRSAATLYDANFTWSGQLPPRARGAGRNPTYSSKIFLGGVPWDITEHSLVMAFSDFGQVRVEWPGRDINSPPRGYLYLVFEDDEAVRDLLTHCTYDYSHGGSYYYKISSRRMRSKEVQIIPWVITDSNFVRCPSPRLESQMTVFVGALHGMINAEGLAIIFNDLFDGVIYAGLDTDKHKYPIGSGRVTFSNATSYMKAVAAAFIEVKTPRFCKKIQVDPYVEDSVCSTCATKQGPYFCRDLSCFKYFCKACWEIFHTTGRSHHIPMMRIIRSFPARRHDSGRYADRNGQDNTRSSDFRNGQDNTRSSDFRNGQDNMTDLRNGQNNTRSSDLRNTRSQDLRNGQGAYGDKNDSAAASNSPRVGGNNQGKPEEMDISKRLGDLSLDAFLRNVLGKTPLDEESNTMVETTAKETKK